MELDESSAQPINFLNYNRGKALSNLESSNLLIDLFTSSSPSLIPHLTNHQDRVLPSSLVWEEQ